LPGLDGRRKLAEVNVAARPAAKPGWPVELREAEVERLSIMKRILVVTSMALTLCAGTLNASANGCCFWPFWAFGLGLGLAAAASSAATSPTYAYPVYSYPYALPAYSYYSPRPVYTYPAPAAPAQTAAAAATPEPEHQVQSWVPSSPGVGKWVPDPQPYRYLQSSETQPVKAVNQLYPMTVSTVSSPGGVPVHVIQ
jgi:hypothetical protein